MIKIIQERDICIGCGACASLCPKHWEMYGDGRATLIGGSLNPDTGNYEKEVDEVGCNQDAADACPVQCIIVSKK
jgi:ferredoxin